EGGVIAGSIRSLGASSIRICGVNFGGTLNVSGTTGLVLIGGDAATGPCAGNILTGPTTITGNSGGVEFNSNPVTGSPTSPRKPGSVPPPDTGPVHAENNTVTGPKTIQ